MPAKIHHGQAVDTEAMILAVVAAETIIRHTVATVAAALLPGSVLRLPVMCTIPLPSNLLLVYLCRAPSLSGPVGLLLALLLLLLPSRLLLLALLALLILLPSGLLLLTLLLLLLSFGLLLLMSLGPSLFVLFILMRVS